MTTSRLKLPLPAVALVLALSGCVSAHQQPDGSTRVRISAPEALRAERPGAPAKNSATSQPTSSSSDAMVIDDYNSDHPLPKQAAATANDATPAGARKVAALRDLQLTIECKPMKNLSASLIKLGVKDDGELIAAPRDFKVFGLPVAKFAFNTNAALGEAYGKATFASGVTSAQIRKAANLKKEKDSAAWFRHAKVGSLFLQEEGGVAELSCAPVHD